MSSSVVSPAQWVGQLPHNPPVDTAPTSRRAQAAAARIAKASENNDKKKPKSISPVPTATATTSTRSTRSRKTVTYGESDSPDLPTKPLPVVPETKPIIRIKKKPLPPKRASSARMSKTNSTQSNQTQSTTSPSSLDKELTEIDKVVTTQQPSIAVPESKAKAEVELKTTPVPVKADLPPSTSNSLKISFKSTANGGIKRLAASQDVPDDGASSTYDITPRISPTPDASGIATAIKGDVEVNGEDGKDAPKRAPRKKRKWLKRGEVDPDDPVAVAKQQERFALLDRADELLEQEMAAVRAGTHPSLVSLLGQLAVRRDIQFGYAEQRHEFEKAEIMKSKCQAQRQARGDHHEASECILADIGVEFRRKKHAVINEKLQIGRTPDSYPQLAFGRGSRGWPIHTDHLISNDQQPMIEFQVDGKTRERRDHDVKLATLSTADAKADLDLIRSLQRKNENEHPSPPDPRRSKHIPTRPDSPRRRPVSGPSRPAAGPSQVAAGSSSSFVHPRNQIWQKNVYDVKDLPSYQAGSGSSVPMRQTPTHSPTPTPSRRPSPSPAIAGPSGSRPPVVPSSSSTLTNGAGTSTIPRVAFNPVSIVERR